MRPAAVGAAAVIACAAISAWIVHGAAERMVGTVDLLTTRIRAIQTSLGERLVNAKTFTYQGMFGNTKGTVTVHSVQEPDESEAAFCARHIASIEQSFKDFPPCPQ